MEASGDWRQLQGDEVPHGETLALHDAPILEFWRWAFSDLRDNTLRGVYAEWLVAQLLGITTTRRSDWEPYDLLSSEGWRIEVKCAAYQQAWHTAVSRPSAISFGRLQSRSWTAAGGYATDRTRNADVYIFCLHAAKPSIRFDALDLDQWEFYVVTAARLAAHPWRSIGLAALQKLTPACSAAALHEAFDRAMSVESPR